MVTRAGLSLIHSLVDDPGTNTIQALSDANEYSTKQFHRVSAQLQQTNDIVIDRGPNNEKLLSPGLGRLILSYRRLNRKAGHVDWWEILSPALLRVVWFLDEPTRISTIADRLAITPQTVYDILEPMRGRAMFSPAGPEYAIANNLKPLLDVADAAVWTKHQRRIRDIAPQAVLEWYDPAHALILSGTADETAELTDADRWQPTGLPAFPDHDLLFLSPHEPPFWHSDQPVLPEHVACHTVLIEPGTRRVSYAMLLIDKLDLDHGELRSVAAWYGVRDVMDDMLGMLSGEARPNAARYLPGRQEYDELRDQYKVHPNKTV